MDKPVGPTSHDIVDRIRASLGNPEGRPCRDPRPLRLRLASSSDRVRHPVVGVFPRHGQGISTPPFTWGWRPSTHDLEGEVVFRRPGIGAASGEPRSKRPCRAFAGPSCKHLRSTPPRRSGGNRPTGGYVEGRPSSWNRQRWRSTAFDLLSVEMPPVQLSVRCSSGTYIRALARDLGRSLGVGGHLSALRRVGIGPFGVDQAPDLTSLVNSGSVGSGILPAAQALSHLPSLEVGPEDAARIRPRSIPDPGGIRYPRGDPGAGPPGRKSPGGGGKGR